MVASVDLGAQIATGGAIPSGPGSFYPPTVLYGVKPGMPAYSEEFFGPVASVIKVVLTEMSISVYLYLYSSSAPWPA